MPTIFVSVTRLRVRSLRFLPAFLWMTFRSQRQAVRAPGFFGGKLLVDAHSTYWTVTVWNSEQGMKGFRGSGAHGLVMKKLAAWCDEAAYAHWIAFEEAIPAWTEAYERLVAEGKLSRVEHPSANHLARNFATPRLSPLIGQNLKPVRAKA